MEGSRMTFGWHFPAGAEGDPRAPYNQRDKDLTCAECGHEMEDHDAVTDEDGQPCMMTDCDCDQYRERGTPDADDLRDMRDDT